ncbi:hypothetical protein MMO38_04000 [Acinetobacter sp. NIPH 1852]|uniref:hypothetical protein n=1 Tax=unclassified Acinetobacter TaxID=196816 RepID=UPI001F4B3DE2|nr:hypothetical protein [Acinetobacter sp. NIPH 1852]MCH7307308.1 hypothetical protein [Acinetobacter sp. NIPH 1852]MDR7016281.1 hypothetical protein [Prolinoborus sp. 3657]
MKLKELFIEIYYDEYSKGVNLKKINKYIENNEIFDVDFFELLDGAIDHEAILLQLIQKGDPNFSVNSFEAEILTARYFLDVLYHYKIGLIQPLRLCQIFSKIETSFLSASRNLEERVVYYPEWISGLYDACDWCDETWNVNNSPHLSVAVDQQINIIKDWLSTRTI